MHRIPVLLVFALVCLAGCDKDNDREERHEEKKTEAKYKSENRNPQSEIAEGGRLAHIQESKVLRIGIKSDAPPFCFLDKDGNPQGFDVDIGARLARHLKVQPVFVTVTSAERIEKLKKGELDVVIATLTATRKRGKEIDFSLPYFQDHQSVLVAVEAPIQSYRDLAGKKVAAAEGTTSIDNLKVVSPDAVIVPCASLTVACDKLLKGEVDAVSGDGLQLEAFRLKEGEGKKYRIAGEGFSVEPYVIGVPRNDSEFRAAVDETLTDIWTSGQWTRIFNKWLGPESPYNMHSTFQMPVLPP